MNFGHHPEPATDFCMEVEAIENEITGRAAGLPPQFNLRERIARAMAFKVGGAPKAIAAKRDLRMIEAAVKAGAVSSPAACEPVNIQAAVRENLDAGLRKRVLTTDLTQLLADFEDAVRKDSLGMGGDVASPREALLQALAADPLFTTGRQVESAAELRRAVHPAAVAPLTAEKYDDVLQPFLALMRKELHANSDKGDRPGWLSMSAEALLLEVYDHVAKLQKAVRHNDGDRILEHSADVANLAMMVLDRCGGIAWAAAAETSSPMQPTPYGLAGIEGDAIVIRLTAEACAFAFANDPQAREGRPPVINKLQFLRDTLNELIAECEDGSTPLTDVLDRAMVKAMENGSDALDHDAHAAQEADKC